MSGDKILAFPGSEALPENTMQIEKSNVMFCSHESVRLSEHERTVNCVKCGAALDPFNFLLNNAKTIQSAWSGYRMMNAKASEIAERVNVLSKEEKRLRAQVKRLQEKSGEVINVRGETSL